MQYGSARRRYPRGHGCADPLAFGKSDQGIDFDAIDGKPVHLFFMVIAPPNEEGNVYLPILGSLVTILNEKANRDKLMKVETFQDFIAIITGE